MPDETRTSPIATLILWLLWGWVVMTVSHEAGHVIAGAGGGARLVDWELRPWKLPHSLFANDGHRLTTLWAGPVLGCVVPLLVAAMVRRPACWFVAWFCVTANASYLLLGYFSGDPELDSTRMIRAGTPPIALLATVVVTLPLGYISFRKATVALMSGQTPSMTRRAWWISAAALSFTLAVQAIVGMLIAASL